jgi:hypothetical protein
VSVDSLEFGDCAVVSRSKLFPAASVVLSLRGRSRDVENMIGGCVTRIAPYSRFSLRIESTPSLRPASLSYT